MNDVLNSLKQLWPIFQRYNLKAIHNKWFYICHFNFAVTNISKIQSESNSQLGGAKALERQAVTNISKIQSESNSQRWTHKKQVNISCDQYFKDTIWKQFTTYLSSPFRRGLLWPIFQRYNLKAIHNLSTFILLDENAVTNISKIQSESNSQQGAEWQHNAERCDQYFKDTIWKQFTTLTYHKLF